MKLGINTFLFASPFTDKQSKLFERFKKWGFDTVEIPIEDPSHIDPARVKRELDKHGLVCGSVCACMGPDRDLRGTPKQQQTSLAYLSKVLEQMVALDCPSLVGPVYSSVGRADAVAPADYKKQWKTVVKHLKTLSKRAEKLGKQICLEPLNRFETDFINTCDQGLQMIRDVGSPALKLHLDTFHMNVEEKNQAAAIRKAGKHLGHFHACGSDRGTPGGDHIDWPAIAKALKDIGYKGDVVIESFTTDVKVIARAAAIWRRIEPTRDEIAVKGVGFLRRTFAN
ncbi:MAG TPA: sugar phosphate isomerase/epimerase [Verrucomicrobiae bacterium]|jgi:D-psicose/D-tagatose/L-ribulose 3-epimerase|nr:sugar phosphate isomerase/epimerase [Verrucomicrobiae bacterium]